MRPRKTTKPVFEVGDFVFAKLRGYRAWPARILQRYSTGNYNVFFYGTCNYARVPRKQVFDFESSLNRLGAVPAKHVGSNASFRGAMRHARNAFSNPSKDFGFSQLQAVLEGDCVNAEDLPMEYEVVTDSAAIVLKGDSQTKRKSIDLPIESEVENEPDTEAEILTIKEEEENDPIDILGTEDTDSETDSYKSSEKVNEPEVSSTSVDKDSNDKLDFEKIKEEVLNNLFKENGDAAE
ncbi:hepatoma-derived growth factor [Drosophila bipectinata]|uniref:hepatoma-derived growth factor n=1 Tax=Drosophila bipectinata TaxID=42026 RepID=UPI001C8AFEC0|nr:hepatoma-derived growth factor [Drosophila bipectinata]